MHNLPYICSPACFRALVFFPPAAACFGFACLRVIYASSVYALLCHIKTYTYRFIAFAFRVLRCLWRICSKCLFAGRVGWRSSLLFFFVSSAFFCCSWSFLRSRSSHSNWMIPLQPHRFAVLRHLMEAFLLFISWWRTLISQIMFFSLLSSSSDFRCLFSLGLIRVDNSTVALIVICSLSLLQSSPFLRLIPPVGYHTLHIYRSHSA